MDRLAAMETFVRVVETGSFSLAARGLGLGQPAVSKAVAQLEERLGYVHKGIERRFTAKNGKLGSSGLLERALD